MIKQEDIRIGNYFLGFDNKPFKWELENFTMVGSSSIDFDEIIKEPIPLTEEWLLKLGFNKVRYEKYSHEKLNKLRAYPHVNKDGFGIYLMGSYTLPNIKYVHQLQNLYYALTGEELKATL